MIKKNITINIDTGNVKKEKHFVDLDSNNNIVYFGIHGKKKDSLIFEVKPPKKVDIKSMETSFEDNKVILSGFFKEEPTSENERIIIVFPL